MNHSQVWLMQKEIRIKEKRKGEMHILLPPYDYRSELNEVLNENHRSVFCLHCDVAHDVPHRSANSEKCKKEIYPAGRKL